MSVPSTNQLDTIDAATKPLANEIENSNETSSGKQCDKRELNESAIGKTTTTIMPTATNNATVTVLSSGTSMPSTEQCSDSEEDFDRTARNLGAHKWIFNYEDVSSAVKTQMPCM